ncbi:hypothetical protein [Saccharothrix variisporea]|uniref:hypothetical protein n=1 Tax=Saccharothrix variisporea TaxID=543527 RepID=UPI0014770785|nr:hypothetical protein [Saccharothrix variisporea]
MLEHVQVRDDAVGAVEWTVSVDSTVVRAHQHAAGAAKRGLRRPLLRPVRHSAAPADD